MQIARSDAAQSAGGVTGPAGGARRAPPAPLTLLGVAVGGAIALPVGYLLLRTAAAGPAALDVMATAETGAIVLRSMVFVACVTVATLLVAVPYAWLTTRTDLPLGRFWSVAGVLPLVIPHYVMGLVIVAFLGPEGMLRDMLAPLGVERLPSIYGLPGAVLALALVGYPLMLLNVRAGLRRVDPELEEASRSLGKGPWLTFRYAVLPQLRPAIAAGGLLVGLYALSDFGAVSLLRYKTFTWAIFLQYDTAFDRTAALALSLLLVVVAASLLLGEGLTRGRWRYHRSGAGSSRPPRSIRLGRWRWPSLAFCAGVVGVSLALPVSVLVYWVVRGLVEGGALGLVLGAAVNSLYVAALAAGVTVLAAVPVVVLSVRYPGRLAWLLERASYVGFALPGIAVALALVFFAANYAMPVYQSIALLVFAYALLFLPTAVGAGRTSLLQVRPQVEEAARSLGRRPWQVFLSISLPAMRPGILAGAALVFLLTMEELPATLILRPTGFDTLATTIWSLASEAFFARAAVPALLLLLASSTAVALMLWRERRFAA